MSVYRIAGVLVVGLSIGWLAGLSTSPVVSILISGAMGAAISIIAVLGGFSKDATDGKGGSARIPDANPLHLCALSVGLAAGASVGLYARTHYWLTPTPSSVLQQRVDDWSSIGISKADVAKALFSKWKSDSRITSAPVPTFPKDPWLDQLPSPPKATQ